ncbi:MAG: VWA domain-containing protein [Thiomicrorhabdus sp.]|jgi:Ca-activated chloride channel family protein|nr:VWA domain-containing protein [Thiomicrorhabdus sp.]
MEFFSQAFFDVFGLFLQGDITWREPNWLWALLLPILWWALKQLGQKQHQQAYADSHLWPWVATENATVTTHSDSLSTTSDLSSSKVTRPGQLLKTMRSLTAFIGSFVSSPSRLITVAWLCLMIALAGPRSLISAPDLQSREGVDILVSMDLSESMKASDLYPTRFLFAKSLVESMTSKLQMGDRLALQGFAGQAHMVSPLSYDRDLFRHSLNLLEPGLLPIHGSWLELAVIGGLTHLSQTAGKAKVMVVFTNGAPQFWKPVELPKSTQQSKFSELQKLSDTGVKIILVGIGLPAATTLPDSEDKSGKLHANGLLVQSRLEESGLKKMAQSLQGVYLRADASQEFMTRLLKEATLPAASRIQS